MQHLPHSEALETKTFGLPEAADTKIEMKEEDAKELLEMTELV
jgi:hypothetical protein